MPLEVVFDWIFNFILNKLPQFGIIGAIVGLSLVVNILALPLYNMADRLQEEEREKQKSMEKWVKHYKKTFKGNEQFMMLSELYRQNNYHPIYALRTTFSILIQLPFFIAAYHYLRTNTILNDVGFLFIKDLSKPDNLFCLKGGENPFYFNILPCIMTAINCISGTIYTKHAPLKEKLQVYVLALVFLALLYTSPSGLVIYWTLNNIFSLIKNFIQKVPHKIWFNHFFCVIE